MGNLWDITDGEIDRFTRALIELWLSAEPGTKLYSAMQQAREACRLRYLTGSAPVMYGLPMWIDAHALVGGLTLALRYCIGPVWLVMRQWAVSTVVVKLVMSLADVDALVGGHGVPVWTDTYASADDCTIRMVYGHFPLYLSGEPRQII